MGTGLDSQSSSDEIKYIIEASSSYNPTKVQLFKQGHVKQKVSIGDVILFVRTITILAIEPTQKRERKTPCILWDKVDRHTTCTPKKCVMKKKKKRTSFPFHIRNACFGFLCQMQETRALPILSSGSCWNFVRGTMCRDSRMGFCSRENVENQKQRHCRRNMSGKLIGSKTRLHARTKETLKRGGVWERRLYWESFQWQVLSPRGASTELAYSPS